MNDTNQGSSAAPLWRRLLPLIILLGLIAGFFALGWQRYLSCDTLQQNRQWLQQQVMDNLLLVLVIYIAAYSVMVAMSLPGGALATLTGGFLFGPYLGAGATVVAATAGAVVLFMIAKTALGSTLAAKAGPWMKKLEAGFQENAFSYLLILRLIPIFPFFVVNLVPALLGVRLRTFAAATAIGIIPGTFVYSLTGAGLGSIFDAGGSCTLQGILTPEILAALIGLALLAILPVIYKKLRKTKASS